MTASPWLYSSALQSDQLTASIAHSAAQLRTLTPVDPAQVTNLVARHNAALKTEQQSAGTVSKGSTGQARPNQARSGAGRNQANQGKKAGAPLYRLINQDAQLTGAAATANQKILAILQQYQAKKDQAQKATAPRAEVGPQFFLESAHEVTADNAGVLFSLCHQLNHTEFKVKADDLQQLNSVEGLYQLPLWALRLKLEQNTDLRSLELMVLPQAAPRPNYRGPLLVVLRFNFAETSLSHLTELEYDEAAQISCAALLLEAVAQVDADLLAAVPAEAGTNAQAEASTNAQAEANTNAQAGAGAELADQCYDQVVRESLSPELLAVSLLLAPYFRAGTTAETRYAELNCAACALGYALTHLGNVSVHNSLTPLSAESLAAVPMDCLAL